MNTINSRNPLKLQIDLSLFPFVCLPGHSRNPDIRSSSRFFVSACLLKMYSVVWISVVPRRRPGSDEWATGLPQWQVRTPMSTTTPAINTHTTTYSFYLENRVYDNNVVSTTRALLISSNRYRLCALSYTESLAPLVFINIRLEKVLDAARFLRESEGHELDFSGNFYKIKSLTLNNSWKHFNCKNYKLYNFWKIARAN